MKLYMFPVAPNPTKVRLYLAEKRAAGVAIDVEEVSVDLRKGEQGSAEHRGRNPLARLPVLELEDGQCLIESLAIIEYLEELHPKPSLIGETPLERAQVRELERIAELGVLIPVARVVHATKSPLGWPANPEVAAYFRAALPPAFGHLDRTLADGRPFVAGERVSIADCTLAAALQFGRFGGVALDPTHAHVAAWDTRYRATPAAKSALSL